MLTQQGLFGPSPKASESQWFTPDWLAERVVQWSGLGPDDRVVELGAGDGAFVRPLLQASIDVVAVERDERFVGALAKLVQLNDPQLAIIHADALAPHPWLKPNGFTAYVGNPPYEQDNDLEFVLRGLELAPRVIAVVRLVFLAGQERHRRLWSKHTLSRVGLLPARPAFVGEKSDGAKADFCAVDIQRGRTHNTPTLVATDWWLR